MTMVSQPISTTISFKEKVVVVSFIFCFVKKKGNILYQK
jgi:hypothetical protein